MASIATNLISLFTQRGLNTVRSALSTSVQRLSSGVRINAAKDDAAGLGISQELQRQTRAFAVSSRNANDAVSMVQTAEGALQSVGDMLQRLKTLTTQGANESLSKDQRAFIADEIAQLRDEINAVATRTTFNGTSLLTGDFSQAVQGEFVKAVELDAAANSVLKTSTIKLGASSATDLDTKRSLLSFTDVQVDDAINGAYSLSNDGATLILSRTLGGKTDSERVTIVTGRAALPGEVELNNQTDGVMNLKFEDLGVSLSVKNDRVGTADRSAASVAAKVVGIGITPNEAYKDKGWKSVVGADWAVPLDPAAPNAANLKAIVKSTGGNIKVDPSKIVGLTGVIGFNGVVQVTDAGGNGLFNPDEYPRVTVQNGSWTSGTATEIAFVGTAAQLNAALSSLQVDNKTGVGEVTVEIGDKLITSNTRIVGNQSITSYYKAVPTSVTWTAAEAAAKLTSYNGLTGYLANVTNAVENTFVTSKLSADFWIGGTDELVENEWRWKGGPEAGQLFWQGGTGGSSPIGMYANWNPGNEPNDSGDEDYAQIYARNNGLWNDLSSIRTLGYIIEYGGYADTPAPSNIKTILLGTPGYINVGDALTLDSVQTSGIGSGAAETGIYKMTANVAAKTLTLKRFDVDGETLLGFQTISEPDGVGSGRYKTLTFDQLGVSVDVTNVSDREITFGDSESGLTAELDVASSRMASLIGDNGPIFQTGVGSRNDIAINVFRDIRLGKNADSQNATLFNEVNDLVNRLDQARDPDTADFQTLENRVEDMITAIADMRGDMGAVQNRLAATRNNIAEQFTNLSAAQSQILDTDFAAEMARLTRMQIGQQASTAMLAQANQLPSVILALLQ